MKIRERKTLNRALLRKLARKLRRLRHEEHYDQWTWAKKTSCGTAACIAGHAVLVAEGKLTFLGGVYVKCKVPSLGARPLDIYTAGRKLLGLTQRQASRLFGGGQRWPPEFAARMCAARNEGAERPSRVAADLLDAIADGKVRS